MLGGGAFVGGLGWWCHGGVARVKSSGMIEGVGGGGVFFFLDPEYLALKGMIEVGRYNDPKRKQKARVVFVVLCLFPVVVVVL